MRTRLFSMAALFAAVLAFGCGVSEQVADSASTTVTSGSGYAKVGRGQVGAPEMARDAAAPPAVPPVADEAVGSAQGAAGNALPLRQTSSAQSAQSGAQQTLAGGMLIRRGNASIEVDSLELAIARVHEVARRVGGVVANTSVQTGREEIPSASIELRVPSNRFDEAVGGLRPIGKVESVNVSVEDVGEEFVDVTARVANARRLEQRLIEVLANRTGKLADVLAVERELARVREEIERYDGRLRYLRERVAVSTLLVAVHEPAPLVATRPGHGPIREALKQAWRNFVGVIAAAIASLGVVVPLGVLLVTGFLVWRRYAPVLRPAGATADRAQ